MDLEQKIRSAIIGETDATAYLNKDWENRLTERILLYVKESFPVELPVKPVDYGTCKNCIFNLEESETSLVSECQLTVDEFTGIGVMFSRDFGCNQWQSKPSV
ncbi:MAG: hypothetical protein IT276_07935 [Ignavibacteriaceae bacterium]|nr:hypothetical protein [Ignavibacteriaceae bacterium]